jgi:hypothetical protein
MGAAGLRQMKHEGGLAEISGELLSIHTPRPVAVQLDMPMPGEGRSCAQARCADAWQQEAVSGMILAMN